MVRNKILLLPVAGIVVFAGLYVTAAALYPGGSQHDPAGKLYKLPAAKFCGNAFKTQHPPGIALK